MFNKWADHYTEKAKAKGYKARSVFKLQEIHERFKIFKNGDRVLDLGCYPGSWTQFALEQVGEKGRVFGIDLKFPGGIRDPRFQFYKVDVLGLTPDVIIDVMGKMDVVLSDLAPSTTGIHVVDCVRSMELCTKAFLLASEVLNLGGHFVFKVFDSEEVGPFQRQLKSYFHTVRALRPKATRRHSREVYTICLGFKKLT